MACWVSEPLFWPFVKKGEPLNPNFGKIISGNIFDHQKDTLGIILSPISGLEDHWFRSAFFWPFVKNGSLLDANFGKIIFGNIFDHKEDNLGIILSPISGL